MKIRYDYSYIDYNKVELVKKGLAYYNLYSVRLDRYFTEEEKEENRKQASLLNSVEWEKRCEEITQKVANSIYNIMEIINKNYKVYQYRSCDIKDYDLFFWCNSGGINGSAKTHDISCVSHNKTFSRWCDLSYITLNISNKNIQDDFIRFLSDFIEDEKNVIAILQMEVVLKEDKIEKAINDFLSNVNEKTFYKYGYDYIKFVNTTRWVFNGSEDYKYNYCFKYKHGRTIYKLSQDMILDIILNNSYGDFENEK